TDFAQQLIAPANIFQVIGRTYVPPAQVVKGVVADAVTFSCKALKNLRILADVIADTKKSCLQCVAFKRIQDKFSRPRNRAVVERQVELIPVCGQPPMKGWIQPRKNGWCSVRYHPTRQESIVMSSW